MNYNLLKLLGELEVTNTNTNKKMICSLKDVDLRFDDSRHYLYVTQIEFKDADSDEIYTPFWYRDFDCDGSEDYMLKMNVGIRKLLDENFDKGTMMWGDGTFDTNNNKIKHYWGRDSDEPHFCIEGEDYNRFKEWYQDCLINEQGLTNFKRKKKIKKVLKN